VGICSQLVAGQCEGGLKPYERLKDRLQSTLIRRRRRGLIFLLKTLCLIGAYLTMGMITYKNQVKYQE
ncbi:hypothetical protein KUCAC02_019598, partial [Chaenocephalus aceratus]